jgi:allophanate hydrolase
MDLAALAVPGPRRGDGIPFGVTLLAPAFHDRRLLELAGAWMDEPAAVAFPKSLQLAVAGAHMSGLELNHQLRDVGARLVRTELTAPEYRLYELPGSGVRRPGLVRVDDGGAAIEIELWELSPPALGALASQVPAPLAMGRVRIADGTDVAGFVCEAHASRDAQDITDHGGWRSYLVAGRA